MTTIHGIVVDIVGRRFLPAELLIQDGIIISIREMDRICGPFLLPGLIDAHVHVESSMLVPSEFARAAMVHGTVGTVSDPHEIANVLGMEGVEFMIDNGRTVPFKFHFGAPSCVPATEFESSGAFIDSEKVETLLSHPDILYLSEMMNFPGVIHGDPQVMSKISSAHRNGKPVDGHAPGLTGEELNKYASAGISTDHECFNLDEAREKISLGIKVQIREGSAAKNFDELIPLLREAPDMVMFCSDDKHPDDLIEGHMDAVLRECISMGYDVFDALRACTLVPKLHYGLNNGLLQVGDPADFILVDNLKDFHVIATYIDGEMVAKEGKCLVSPSSITELNRFEALSISAEQLRVPDRSAKIRVIEAYDGQLITGTKEMSPLVNEGNIMSDEDRDILKLVVYNRYKPSTPSMAFIHGFGLKNCALSSTVAHDSHNIIAVGTSDELIKDSINQLVKTSGGICYTSPSKQLILPLPIGGIMSNLPVAEVAARYKEIDELAKNAGSGLQAPFMTLSFMALLVIPSLKLSDRGLFDGRKFQFIELYVE